MNDPAENGAAELVVTVTTAASSSEGQPPGSGGGAESLENAEQQDLGQKQRVGTTEKKRGKAKPMKTS